MVKKATVSVNGSKIEAPYGTIISEVALGETPCGGHGKCGKCKVMVTGEVSSPTEAEKSLLSEDELGRGIRLACMARVLGDCAVTTDVFGKGAVILTDGELSDIEIKHSFAKFGLAVDVGTTTLVARLYSSDGKLMATASSFNPQRTWGADVISRVEAALSGKDEMLAEAVRGGICALIDELCRKAGVEAKDIDGGVITGNTVMLYLLARENTEPFSRAPFEIERRFGEVMAANDLGLHSLSPETQIYIPAVISAFVGADAVCAIMATDLASQKTAMLADIGTNGEMALWHKDALTVCSTAAGPAFEGVGISMGMRGEIGAIDKVAISGGKPEAHIIGEVEPRGICGSGLIDAAACLLDLEIIDETGFLEDGEAEIKSPVLLTDGDIRKLQLAKSAISAGLVTLARCKKAKADEISKLYIAGGFGNYLNLNSAVKIGLLPADIVEKTESVGNAALAGASMLLLNDDIKSKAELLAKRAEVLELNVSPIFTEAYISGMMLGEIFLDE